MTDEAEHMRYRVEGADRNTGEEMATTIEADSPEDAANIASDKNILVSSIAAVEDATAEELLRLTPGMTQEEFQALEQQKMERLRQEYRDPFNTYLLLHRIKGHSERIAYWMKFWSIWTLVGCAVAIVWLLVFWLRANSDPGV